MKKIVVLVSGSGSNLQRIMEAIENQEITNATISLVLADRTCYGIERAENKQLKTCIIPRKNIQKELINAVPLDTDLIVLAGFLSILSEAFCQYWKDKIINIHPSLLPKYGGKGMWGRHVHQAVVDAKEIESGATVHFVTSGIDEGKIILQKSVPVSSKDTPTTLAEKVLEIEHEILPKAIQNLIN